MAVDYTFMVAYNVLLTFLKQVLLWSQLVEKWWIQISKLLFVVICYTVRQEVRQFEIFVTGWCGDLIYYENDSLHMITTGPGMLLQHIERNHNAFWNHPFFLLELWFWLFIWILLMTDFTVILLIAWSPNSALTSGETSLLGATSCQNKGKQCFSCSWPTEAIYFIWPLNNLPLLWHQWQYINNLPLCHWWQHTCH